MRIIKKNRSKSDKKRKEKSIEKIKKEIKNVNFEDEVFLKSSFSVFEVSIITLIAILFGIIIGYLINYSKDASLNKNLDQIVTTYQKLVNNYYGTIDEDKLSSAAINGMIDSLEDPYSNYMDNSVSDSFNQMINGSYVGIGITVKCSEDGNVITEVMGDGPGKRAGLKVGDIIIKVDKTDVTNICGDELVGLIKGKANTKVKVVVNRDGEELEFDVSREKINLDSVSTNIYASGDASVGYIKIDIFAANTASQFNAALSSLEDENIDSLIIDVRDNPGGHLTQARRILSNFFDKKTILYQVKTKGNNKKIYSMSNDKRDYPVAVLINNSSASAAEVLASCFKDNYQNAIIVGENSYGKGTIQRTEQLSNGSSIKYTTDEWLTSTGKCLDKKGVKPDYEVSNENLGELSFENDKQLQTALNNIRVVNEIGSAKK